jgi:hypothetical protein
MKKIAIVLFAACCLFACGTMGQNEYHPYSAGLYAPAGGYTETQLDSNKFSIDFIGSTAGISATPETRVKDFALLRAAELTLQYGFKYFAVIDSHNHDEYISPYHEITITIVCGNTEINGYVSYNAEFLKNSIVAKYFQ